MVIKSQAANPLATLVSTRLRSVHLAKAIRSLQLRLHVSRVISVSTQRMIKLAPVRAVSISIRTVSPAKYVMTRTVLNVAIREMTVKCATQTSYLAPRKSASALLTLDISPKTLNASRAWLTATNAQIAHPVASAPQVWFLVRLSVSLAIHLLKTTSAKLARRAHLRSPW